MPGASNALRALWSWTFLKHFIRLHIGLFLFGCAVTLMLEAQIGLDPWSAFHDGASRQLGWSFGRVSQATGAVLIVSSWLAMRVRPGIGTVCNMLLVGPWVDLLRVQPWIPFTPTGVSGTVQFVLGLVVMGLASAVYLGARLGAGPRDGFVLGLSLKVGTSLRATRISVEVMVLVLAVLIGGPIGLGTVVFALLMGPIMQTFLRLFRVSHDPSPSWRSTVLPEFQPELP
jgi:uncharacterized membrane protein YczE